MSADAAPSSGKPPTPIQPSTPIRWPLRAWLVVEVFFGITAILSAFLRPEDTAETFAWPIQPVVMAAVLGAFYLAAGSLFALGLFARRWEELRVIVIPSIIFTAAMLLTTFLHWAKFSVGTLPFYVWFASYILPPPAFMALYWWHQRESVSGAGALAQPLAAGPRRFFEINGYLVTALALICYLSPSLMQMDAPWNITPLAGRALCGWLLAYGLLQLSMAREGEWARIRLATAMLMLLPLALFMQLGRFAVEVRWASLPLWVLLVDVSLGGLLCLALWLRPGLRHYGLVQK
jgi:hypothetical protein